MVALRTGTFVTKVRDSLTLPLLNIAVVCCYVVVGLKEGMDFGSCVGANVNRGEAKEGSIRERWSGEIRASEGRVGSVCGGMCNE